MVSADCSNYIGLFLEIFKSYKLAIRLLFYFLLKFKKSIGITV
jgi:hypothetical protein